MHPSIETWIRVRPCRAIAQVSQQDCLARQWRHFTCILVTANKRVEKPRRDRQSDEAMCWEGM